MKDLQTADPKAHIRNIKSELQELAEHIQKDIDKVDEPRTRALFETSAEVLAGLIKAYTRHEMRIDQASRDRPSGYHESNN